MTTCPNSDHDVPVSTDVSPVTVTAEDAVNVASSQGAAVPSAAAIGRRSRTVNTIAERTNTTIDARAGDRRGMSAIHRSGARNRAIPKLDRTCVITGSLWVAEETPTRLPGTPSTHSSPHRTG